MKVYRDMSKPALGSIFGVSLPAETRKALIKGIKKATWFIWRRKLDRMDDMDLIALAEKLGSRSESLKTIAAEARQELLKKQMDFARMLQNIARSSSPYSSGSSDAAMCSR
jgi:hypothetical protein